MGEDPVGFAEGLAEEGDVLAQSVLADRDEGAGRVDRETGRREIRGIAREMGCGHTQEVQDVGGDDVGYRYLA